MKIYCRLLKGRIYRISKHELKKMSRFWSFKIRFISRIHETLKRWSPSSRSHSDSFWYYNFRWGAYVLTIELYVKMDQATTSGMWRPKPLSSQTTPKLLNRIICHVLRQINNFDHFFFPLYFYYKARKSTVTQLFPLSLSSSLLSPRPVEADVSAHNWVGLCY